MTAILGPPRVSVIDAEEWALDKGATDRFGTLARLYWAFAGAHGGVRPEVAYAQSAKETAYGHFGGVLDPSYHNPCGMKKAGGGGNYDPEAHQRFGTWAEGVAAHLDHLALYAGADGYPRKTTFDPRHFAAIRGLADTVEELGGRWAPAADYGVSITALVSQMKETEPVMAQLVSRSGWGAIPPESPLTPWDPGALLGVTVHHFSSPRSAATHAGCDDLMRSVQRGHQAGEFTDIAYNHCFCKHGVAFEARGFGFQTGANGSSEANRNYASICYMGHSGLDGWPEVAQDAAAWLLSEWFKRGTNRVVVPHRKWTGTECPGSPAHTWVVDGGWRADLPIPPAKRMRWEAWDEGTKLAESATEPIGDPAVENARLKTFVSANLGKLGSAARNEGGVGDFKIVRRVLT